MKHGILIVLMLVSSIGLAQHRPVMISDAPMSCEPSIKVNPSNPKHLLVGTIMDQVACSFDGGETWELQQVESPYGVWGDPVMDIGPDGMSYFFHLSNPPDGDWIDRIVCQRSADGGLKWDEGTFVGLNGSKDQDKHWSAIDMQTGTIHLTWTEFDAYGSKDSLCHSRILYAYSEDRGETWSNPESISSREGDCIDGDETTEGAVPSMGPDGEVYVAWAGPEGILFRSKDGKDSWGKEVKVDDMPSGWEYAIPGIYRANGLPVTACDLSQGPYRGRIYVNWSDQRNGEGDTEIWLKYSDDQGKSWSDLKRVNQDIGAHQQFFTWMDVDPVSGIVYFVYYDRRDSRIESPWETAVYMAMSIDGGDTFHEFRIDGGKGFIPSDEHFFGDYNNISAHNGTVRPVWTRMDENKLSVWTSIINPSQLGKNLELLQAILNIEKKGEICFLHQGPGGEHLLEKRTVGKGKSRFYHVIDRQKLKPGEHNYSLIKGQKVLWSREIFINDDTQR